MGESDSGWLKILRATEHLNALKNGIAADSSRDLKDALILRLHSESKATLDLPKPNSDFAILAGEIIYHLRSALDHLAFDLVKQNRSGIILPADWEEHCMFPTWTELKPGQKPPLPYGVFKALPGIPKEAHAIIERVQPYYGPGIRAINNFLGFLVALSNIDKHRDFALTRHRIFYEVNMLHESGRSTSTAVSLNHGAELPDDFLPEDADRVVDVDRSLSFFVTFDERSALRDATDVRIEYFLEQMLVSIVTDIYHPLRAIMGD